MAIKITLTAYNMGSETTEADFDAWAKYVAENIDESMGFEVESVDQFPFRGGPDKDAIEGGTGEQRVAIRDWLSVIGWEAWCSLPAGI